jgi:hypothetical protein
MNHIGKFVISALCMVGSVCGGIAYGADSAVYYVDSQFGDDTRSGATPTQAWKTLDQINAHIFRPGDQIFLRAGTRYTGQLRPRGSGSFVGTQPTPITLGMFGSGPKPVIEGQGQFRDALLLRNAECWEIQDLEISNLGTNRQPGQTGVRVTDDGFGEMRHIYLRNLFVHDVNGDLRKEAEGCGILFESRGGENSHFDNLLVENCHVLRTDRNGICQFGGSKSRSLHIVIRSNLLEDIGGDGIKLWGSDGGLIEHNILHGGRTRCDDYAAGIWPFDCDDTIIQCNEVSGMKGTKDGEGFDSDYLCRRSVFQYNYSHDNQGGFILICAPGSSYNEDTVVRYNISQNDGTDSTGIFNFSGGAKDTRIYNNTVYVGKNLDLALLHFSDWNGGNASGTQFRNNIFYVDGRVRFEWGRSTDNTFGHNILYAPHSPALPGPDTIAYRPPLRKAGTGLQGMESLNGYTLTLATRFPRGEFIAKNGGRDFYGRPLPQDGAPSIGAAEFIPQIKLLPPKLRPDF